MIYLSLVITCFLLMIAGGFAMRALPRYKNYGMLAVLVGIIGLVCVAFSPVARRDAGLRRGLGPQCGYDLRASHDRCPECGAMREREDGEV
jgi:hypothetical protein